MRNLIQRFADENFLEQVEDKAVCSLVSVLVSADVFVDVARGSDAIVKVDPSDSSCIRWFEGRGGKEHQVKVHMETSHVRVIRPKVGPMVTWRCFSAEPTDHQNDVACFRGHVLEKMYGSNTSSSCFPVRRSKKASACFRCNKEVGSEALQLTCKACDYRVCCPCFESRPSWQFETDARGLWSFMSPQDVSKLETKYTDDPSASLTLSLGAKNWNYTIDFSLMTQVNPRNDTTRSLRRVGGPYVKSIAVRKQEEEQKQEEQRRRAQDVADQIFQAEAKKAAEMEEESRNKQAEADVRKRAKAEAAAQKKADDEAEAKSKQLEAEAFAAAEHAKLQIAEAVVPQQTGTGMFCTCCSRTRTGDDADADMPVQYEYDAKP